MQDSPSSLASICSGVCIQALKTTLLIICENFHQQGINVKINGKQEIVNENYIPHELTYLFYYVNCCCLGLSRFQRCRALKQQNSNKKRIQNQEAYTRKKARLDKRNNYQDLILQFEDNCKMISYNHCTICKSTSLTLEMNRSPPNICKACHRSKIPKEKITEELPVWKDEEGKWRYDLPEELACLREGEKLLIQQISVYVPLHH